ncbi:MAG: hypothetical protein ORN54_04915 [Cyclobacteriaceae bacterium]|nr:hypothetical protein [Cyclobacteriaceae bacterium]
MGRVLLESFFEREQDKSYFFEEFESLADSRMIIVLGHNKHRMIFMFEDYEDFSQAKTNYSIESFGGRLFFP